ncbi:MAG: tautomerase family protein [Oscillospiraceae bacterium]|nr:tautomerase family protein [Oscillospiraceae bacterium]
MPHVEIKCFSGRTDEQKRKCAEKVADDIAAILGCEISSVSIAIKDVDEKDWKEEVWDKNIITNKDYLYKKPGYTYD